MLLKENVLKSLDDLYRELFMSECATQEECKNLRMGVLRAIYAVKEMPTVDAVPVVRCKDCKWCRCYDKLLRKYECTRFLGSMQVREDDFCSYGKRKDGGAND